MDGTITIKHICGDIIAQFTEQDDTEYEDMGLVIILAHVNDLIRYKDKGYIITQRYFNLDTKQFIVTVDNAL